MDRDDAAMVDALIEAHKSRWGHQEELAATQADLLHMIYRLLHAANTKPKSTQPKPWRYPRPFDEKPKPLRPSDFFAHVRRG